ncbi:MAG: hypothetical protein Tsb0034_29920 [Ekhidna sp.]
MSKTSLAILIELANRDGEIDEREHRLIHQIGEAHGLSIGEIEDLISAPPRIDYSKLTEDERFEMLYDLVRLMKVDGKIFDEEILYCLDVAKRLHYPLEAVMELYGLVHANLKLTSEINKLKRKYREGESRN